MSDGSLLVSIDNSSYATYMKEEVDSYRVMIDNKTCVFEKENDPTLLRYVEAVVRYICLLFLAWRTCISENMRSRGLRFDIWFDINLLPMK